MRDQMERHQSWIYLAFILAGLAVGIALPDTASRLEAGLWPLLGVLGSSQRDLRFGCCTTFPEASLLTRASDAGVHGAPAAAGARTQ